MPKVYRDASNDLFLRLVGSIKDNSVTLEVVDRQGEFVSRFISIYENMIFINSLIPSEAKRLGVSTKMEVSMDYVDLIEKPKEVAVVEVPLVIALPTDAPSHEDAQAA